MLSKISREQFVKAITSDKGDRFAKTFVSKADMQELWDDCIGYVDPEGNVLGAIITTISKRTPKVANLQLLHTFAAHRGMGVAKILTEAEFKRVRLAGARYFRVSSEPDSTGFYDKIGFKFWGLQKSGCSLSMFRIVNEDIRSGVYDKNDPTIKKCVFGKTKGCVVKSTL